MQKPKATIPTYHSYFPSAQPYIQTYMKNVYVLTYQEVAERAHTKANPPTDLLHLSVSFKRLKQLNVLTCSFSGEMTVWVTIKLAAIRTKQART